VLHSKKVAPALTSVGFVSDESPMKRLFVAPIGSYAISKPSLFGVERELSPPPVG